MAKRSAGDTLRDLLEAAAGEARIRGDRRIGTDHLLMALLRQADSPVAAELGVSWEAAAAAVDSLDRDALAAVGIDIRKLEMQEAAVQTRRLPALSSGSREVIKEAVEIAGPHKTGRIDPAHFVAALLLRAKPDPAIELLEYLGVDVADVRDRLAGKVSGDGP